MMEYIAMGALGLTTVGAGYKWFLSSAQLYIERIDNELLHEDIAAKDREIAALGSLIEAHEAEEERRLAPLKAANAKRHQAKLDRDAANAARQEAVHAELRELVGGLI